MDWKKKYEETEFTLEVNKQKITVASLRLAPLIVKSWVNNLIAEEPTITSKNESVVSQLYAMSKSHRDILTKLLGLGEVFVFMEDNKIKVFDAYSNKPSYTEDDDGLVYFKVSYTENLIVDNLQKSVTIDLVVSKSKSTNGYNIEYDYGSEYRHLNHSSHVISLKFPVLRLSNRYDWHDNVPIYYPSVKKIEDTNKIYAEMMLDVILGRKMILLPEDTANRLKKERSPDGSNFSYINASNLPTVFERFNAGDEVGDNGIVPQIYDSVIRPDKYIETINFQLNLIAVEVGLGAGYFSFEGSKGLRTATEVVSERTDLNINRKNLTQHLDKLIVWMGHQLGATDVEVQMYDNVIEDDGVRKKQLHMDMQARLLNLDWYLKEMYGLTEEEIKEARSQMIGDGE